MKLTGKSRTYANKIINHIESLGGKLQKECPGGSIYCSLIGLRQVRISDHIALKGDIDRVDIVIQKEKEKYKFICIYYRNIVIYDNVGRVKQWLEDIEFAINIVMMNMATNTIVNKRDYEAQIDKLKKELTLKDEKLAKNKREIEELKEFKKNYDKAVNDNRKFRKKIDKLTTYHNLWQTVSSENKKLNKKLKELYIYQSHTNDG